MRRTQTTARPAQQQVAAAARASHPAPATPIVDGDDIDDGDDRAVASASSIPRQAIAAYDDGDDIDEDDDRPAVSKGAASETVFKHAGRPASTGHPSAKPTAVTKHPLNASVNKLVGVVAFKQADPSKRMV